MRMTQTENISPLGKMGRNIGYFPKKLGSWSQPVRKCFCQIGLGRSEICVVLGSERHFVQILQKLFAFFYSLSFVQIFIIARIFT
jgi:hypothetical protein